MTRHLIFLALSMSLLAGLATSCNHKDLCYEEINTTKIRVAYDWRDAPDANPAGMCVFFYSTTDPGTYYRFDFDNTQGGEIEIPQGDYLLITYNNDTEAVRFSATNDYDAHMAYTRDGDLLEPLYGNGVTSTAITDNGERVVITPDALWGCHATDVNISEHGVKYTYYPYDEEREERGESEESKESKEKVSMRGGDGSVATESNGDQVITLYPHDMLCHYSYEVRHVENAEHVNRVSASLSGMAPSLNLSTEALPTEPVTLPVSGQADGTTKQITGKFLTFGQNPANNASHKMTFYVVMDDGKKYVLKDAPNLDVTTQVDNAPDRRHVHIIIDRLTLPGPGGSEDAGWLPTVDDWGVQEEELHV